MNQVNTYKIGYWSSIAVSISVVTFAASILINFLGIDSNYISFIASFILAPAFVILMTANYFYANSEKKIWGFLGVIFSMIYSVFVMAAYFLLITIVYKNNIGLSNEVLKLLIFMPGTALFSINMLGYAFMSLATLFGAFVFNNEGIEKRIKTVMIINGLFFVSSLIFPMLKFSPDINSVQSPDIFSSIAYLSWCVLFLIISISLAILYKKKIEKN